MWKSLVSFEAKWLWRQPVVWISLILFTVIGLLALQRGQGYASYQKSETDSVAARHQRAYAKLTTLFDTTNFSGKERVEAESPWTLDWQLWEFAVKPVSPFSVLHVGQNDVTSRIKRTRFSSDIFSNEQDEFRNPMQLLNGNLDLSFVFVFLFPLLLIALTYNVYSADREAGLDRLTAVQSPRPAQVTFGKIWFRWLLALVPVLISLLVVFPQLYRSPGFEWSEWFAWLGVILLYALFWLGIVRFVVARAWSSLTSILALAGIWLLLLVGLPGIVNSVLQMIYPDTYSREVAALRDDKSRFYELPMRDHIDYFRKHFPGTDMQAAEQDSMESRYASYAHMSVMREKEIHQNMVNRAEQMEAAERSTFWFNPAAATLRSFSAISRSTLDQQFRFETEVLDFRQKKLEYLFNAYFSGGRLDRNEFKKLPLFKQDQEPAGKAERAWIPLLLMTIAAWALPIFFRNRIYRFDQ